MLEMKGRGAGKAMEAMKSRGAGNGWRHERDYRRLKVQWGLLQGSHSLEREEDQCAGKKAPLERAVGGRQDTQMKPKARERCTGRERRGLGAGEAGEKATGSGSSNKKCREWEGLSSQEGQ